MANQMRADLGLLPDLSEKKMFGGLCFLLNGHMVCGVHKGGAMYRPGKPREAEAPSPTTIAAPFSPICR
jgi:hypothetical protein